METTKKRGPNDTKQVLWTTEDVETEVRLFQAELSAHLGGMRVTQNRALQAAIRLARRDLAATAALVVD